MIIYKLIITRYVSKVFGYFNMFSTDHVPLMLSSTQMLGHIVLANHSTTLADYSRVSFSNTLATHQQHISNTIAPHWQITVVSAL